MARKDQQRISWIFSSTKHNHILPDGKQRPAEDQLDIQQAQNHNHIQANGKQRPAEDEQDIPAAQNTITLPSDRKQRPAEESRIFSGTNTQSHTL